jgi:predicted TIM-barrel fold metal-dependent hydrolase
MTGSGGRRKVLFGTNFPMIGHAAALDGIDELGLDVETRELFLHGNAERLLKLSAGEGAL